MTQKEIKDEIERLKIAIKTTSNGFYVVVANLRIAELEKLI